MNCSLPSPNNVQHSVCKEIRSAVLAGVRFYVRSASLRQRIELTRRVRELAAKHEFLRAGNEMDQLEAALADLYTRQLYLEWGLDHIEGLEIDGQPASYESLINSGPEKLADEIVEAIQAEYGLSDEERKNY